ncbi:hypothetical protein BUE80_DR011085 [Diplocarpon rosae]|nr:hypothetical protein BUE80_DR011085 [Diplocarpon rosae]
MAWVLLAAVAFPVVLALGTPKVCENPKLSCGGLISDDLCCFNSPAGQFFHTQIWDANPKTGKFTGPTTSWTIHGLWPNHCDGGFGDNCDPSRKYTDIGGILKRFDKTELLSYMRTYWHGSSDQIEAFWEREWEKHGTCISSLSPNCYNGYTPYQEVVDYFQSVVNVYKKIDSYAVLEKAGIVPSVDNTYTSDEIHAALKKGFGHPVIIRCYKGTFNEIWYSYNTRGSMQMGEFVPTTPQGVLNRCPSTGIRYLPKNGQPAPVKPAVAMTPTGTGSFSQTGHLKGLARGEESYRGCLIGTGEWHARRSCALYTAVASGPGFTLLTTKGKCGIVNSILTCGPEVTPTVFTKSEGKLAFQDWTVFFVGFLPKGSEKTYVYTRSEPAKELARKLAWESARMQASKPLGKTAANRPISKSVGRPAIEALKVEFYWEDA